jgi:hypothetical protein
VEAGPVWADGPSAKAPLELDAPAEDLDQPELDLGAALADRLCAARDSAEAARGADQRSRSALYRALSQAYDFALAAEAEPTDYAELLDDAGLRVQARAPMTPIVKLVFGADSYTARSSEFCAAHSFARREDLPIGGLRDRLDAEGLKALVQAERRARRPEPRPDMGEAAREKLREAQPLARLDMTAGNEEFVLLVARRDPFGGLAVVATLDDAPLVDRAIRKAAA